MGSKLPALIQKKSKPKLILSAVLILAALSLFFYYRSFIKSKIIGADVVSTFEEVVSHFNSGDAYVTVRSEYLHIEDLVVATTTTENGIVTGRKNTSFFASANVGDMLLVIQLPYRLHDDESFSLENVEITGRLKAPTDDFDVIGRIADNLSEEYDIPRSMIIGELLIPVYLEATGDTTATMLTSAGLLIFLFAVINFIINLTRIVNPKSHGVYRQLRKFGVGVQDEYALEREIADDSGFIIAHFGHYDYITDNYILTNENGKLKLAKTGDVVWAYRRDIKNRGATAYYIVLRMRDGKTRRTMTVKTQDEAENAMRSIFERLPVICGYSAELDRIYSKKSPEFDKLLEARCADFDAGHS